MKRAVLILFVVIYSPCFFCQNFNWAKKIGGSGYDYANSMAVDSNGCVYTTGYFSGTVDFDPGPANYPLVSKGGSDLFIQKLDSLGNFIWAISVGGTGQENAQSLALDGQGSVYVTGFFQNVVDFDNSAATYTLNAGGTQAGYILKIGKSGNFIWAKGLCGLSASVVSPAGLKMDSHFNIYLTGFFIETVDFNPGAANYYITPVGDEDAFILKLDSAANFSWVKSVGGNDNDLGQSLDIDQVGNVYVTGYYFTAGDFNPGSAGFALFSNGYEDTFILKLNQSGNFVWARSIGGTSNDLVYSLKLDKYCNVYIAGSFNGVVDFDPGAAVSNMTSKGWSDIFIMKMDSAGTYKWAKTIGGTSYDKCRALAIDDSSNIYATGSFRGRIDFDTNINSSDSLAATGSYQNTFILKLDSTGNHKWVKNISCVGYQEGICVYPDVLGNVYVSGIFDGTGDFDPGIGNFNLSSSGNNDGFILKLGPHANLVTGINHSTPRPTIRIYPNPNNGSFIIKSEKNVTLSLINSEGKKALSVVLNESNFRETKIEKLFPGVYLLMGEDKDRFMQKIVVVN